MQSRFSYIVLTGAVSMSRCISVDASFADRCRPTVWTTHGIRHLVRRYLSVDLEQKEEEERRGQVRAAVSVCVRCHVNRFPYYLLVKRGKEPNKNMWSLPGGGLYFGEATLLGGMRELAEETKWYDGLIDDLLWYPGTICTSDSIGDGFHYLIAHCFAESVVGETFPVIQAADDAADADWFTKTQIQDMEVVSNCTPGVLKVIDRIESLSNANVLDTVSKQEAIESLKVERKTPNL